MSGAEVFLNFLENLGLSFLPLETEHRGVQGSFPAEGGAPAATARGRVIQRSHSTEVIINKFNFNVLLRNNKNNEGVNWETLKNNNKRLFVPRMAEPCWILQS